jgi:hypothetical protein
MCFSIVNFTNIDFFTNESQNNYVTKLKIKPWNMGTWEFSFCHILGWH